MFPSIDIAINEKIEIHVNNILHDRCKNSIIIPGFYRYFFDTNEILKNVSVMLDNNKIMHLRNEVK